jgi:uncharacterized membrane protein
MKKTKFKDRNKYKIGEIIIIVMFIIFLLPIITLILLKGVLKDFNLDIFLVPALFPIVIFVGILISILYGKIRVKKKEILIEKELKLDNPYIYYRELPNNFGIGISSILVNKTIENEKDIIACILDLCARKYLKLDKVYDKYVITILKTSTYNLLSNEVYILEHLMNNTVEQIDYQVWHQLCFENGKELGLFEDNREVNISENNQRKIVEEYYKTNEEQLKKIIPIVLLIGAILGSTVFVFPNITDVFAHFFNMNNDMTLKIISFVSIMFITFMLLMGIYGISRAVFIVLKTVYQNRDMIYQNTLSTKIIHTLKGQDAAKKLFSFKMFLRDFGSFAEKNPEEIILWDEYLSFAILFNLTDEILKTGYKQLIENSSFKIDGVDNINLQNMKVNI